MNFANSTEDVFVKEVMLRLVAEHGRPVETFEYLIPKIKEAYTTERGITVDQMNELFHGVDSDDISGVSDGLQTSFPLLNTIGLSPYVDEEADKLNDAAEKEAEDEAEDDEEDDEEVEEEDEEDEEE